MMLLCLSSFKNILLSLLECIFHQCLDSLFSIFRTIPGVQKIYLGEIKSLKKEDRFFLKLNIISFVIKLSPRIDHEVNSWFPLRLPKKKKKKSIDKEKPSLLDLLQEKRWS